MESRRTVEFLRRFKAENGVRYEDRYPGRHGYPGMTPSRQAAYARRRAVIDAAVETFDRTEVFDRDAWVCGICHAPVSPDVRYPDPQSASLDHIQPLSLGGDHTRENTRLAHLRCNVQRGAGREANNDARSSAEAC